MSRCTKRHCIFNAETLNPECDLISCPYRTEANDLKTEREIVLEELAKEDLQVLALAYVYAKNLYMYGIDVTKAICSATENVAVLKKAYDKGYYDAMNKKMAEIVAQRAMDKLIESGAFIGWWIPVSEELPEDGTWNLFTDGNKISIERYKADAIDHFYPNGRWFSLDEAIAWMPLPEPYRESEEDKGGDENGTNNHSTK